MLTGRQLIDQGIITGYVSPINNIQQHGVDLNLILVSKILDKVEYGSYERGFIPNDLEGKRKTVLATRTPIQQCDDGNNQPYWNLEPGAYDIVFSQGCAIPPNQKMKIIHRSSLYRNGGVINSALFDAGFKTESMGCIMIVTVPITIEVGARVAQAHVYPSNEVLSEDLYNGQFQNDSHRTR